MFLDDCRLARNKVIARQPLTLAAAQYQQIVRPIQRAYAEKRTRVNPASFLLADERELRQFWETARLNRQAGGDKHEISESIEPPRKRPPRTPEEREQLISGALWAGWRHDAGDTGGRVLAI
ncbi:STY4199 family HEPN domain-containing protein [Salmonella enterica]|uniref:STY4199 family HEPN domain-containing protein n=1 Tax=Salmonella enterica TaxID=28901 RepID=UPI003A5BE13B